MLGLLLCVSLKSLTSSAQQMYFTEGLSVTWKAVANLGAHSKDSVFRCGSPDTLYSVTQFVKSRALQMFALGHGGYCEDVSMGQ